MSHVARMMHARCMHSNNWVNIMTKRNQSRAQTTTQNDTTNDQTNVELHDAHVNARTNDVVHDQMTNALMQSTNNVSRETNSTITLKQLLNDKKIKIDSKLIRRVLRKYYASKINHQHRESWTFNTNQIDDVVALIDKHCRVTKSSNAS